MILSLTMGDNGTLTWWVDASYAVHDDMHSHTGGTVSAGTRSVCTALPTNKRIVRELYRGLTDWSV